jgi:hypothetical protein
MARSDRGIPEGDAASLERLRQVTARIRARAAVWAGHPGERRPAPPAPRQQEPAPPHHWSDGPLAEVDAADEDRTGDS